METLTLKRIEEKGVFDLRNQEIYLLPQFTCIKSLTLENCCQDQVDFMAGIIEASSKTLRQLTLTQFYDHKIVHALEKVNLKKLSISIINSS